MSFGVRDVGKSFSTNSTHVRLLLLLFVAFTMVFSLVFPCLFSLFFFAAHLHVNYHNDFAFHL